MGSIIALSKLYSLADARLFEILVEGDLIVPKSDRIMTRSRAKQVPDEYTMIPAQVKIIKVLVEELLGPSGNRNLDASAAAEFDDDDEEDGDDDWEDDPSPFLNLDSGMTRAQLMAYGAGDETTPYSRGRDDETQQYLVEFFRQQAQKAEFGEIFNALSPAEQEKLRSMDGGSVIQGAWPQSKQVWSQCAWDTGGMLGQDDGRPHATSITGISPDDQRPPFEPNDIFDPNSCRKNCLPPTVSLSNKPNPVLSSLSSSNIAWHSMLGAACYCGCHS
nr:importin subunit beta-5 [Quercus suber]